MANTYTQIHIQLVFAVKRRRSLVQKEWKEILYKYITGVIQNNGHKVLAINGMPDHIHILIGLRPAQSLSALVQDIKANSSRWINEQRLSSEKFEWQEGYGAFSYCKSHVMNVIKYIQNQELHHNSEPFDAEYKIAVKRI